MVHARTVETRRLDRLARLVISSELSLSLCGSLPAEPSLSESLLLPDDSAPLSPWLPESSPSLESSHLVSNDGLTRVAPTPARADGLDAFREECPLGDAKTSSTWPSFFWHTGERVKDGNSCQQLAAHTHTHTPHTHTQTQTHTHTQTQTQTQTHRHRHRHTDTHRHTQTHARTYLFKHRTQLPLAFRCATCTEALLQRVQLLATSVGCAGCLRGPPSAVALSEGAKPALLALSCRLVRHMSSDLGPTPRHSETVLALTHPQATSVHTPYPRTTALWWEH